MPAFNEGDSIGQVVTALRAAAPWHEVLVVDDGSTDGTGKAAQDAGARVVRHPYNKGNGAAVKTAIRAATSDWIAIVDADGQHRADDALRLIARLGEYDLVIGARDPRTQATRGRRLGNAILNWLAQLPDRAADSGSDLRLPGGAARVPARVHPPAAQRLLDADHDDAGLHQGRLQCGVRADWRARRASARRRSGWPATAPSFC